MPDSSIIINPGAGGPVLDTIEKNGEHREIVVPAFAEWSVVAEASNAAATVTRPAEVGKRHYVTGFVASFDSIPTVGRRLELKEGAVVKMLAFFADSLPSSFTAGLRIAENTDVSLTLAAGGVGVAGAVTLMGWTA